ncbi:Transcription initiation factor TFIID subunit 9 [Orchesella cincta]|uniref:Transcription initiation factor TFIID subunit 9 n=1 Tax=Orchesella cincta TaxID=48709 RepID=A0A1D2MYA7_ORCCI|nr:Transcription initiation factor TFIID subunit 9 [Orchesella cincta]
MASSHTQTKQIPRDAAVMHAILKEMGVPLYEPRVVNQMLEFVYRYITNVVEEARVYSSYAKKKTVDNDDVKIAIKMLNDKSLSCVPPRELLLDIAKTKNTQPLPLLKSGSGLRLPPDRYCLTQTNYQLQLYKKSIASSNSKPSNINVRLPGSSGSFKTPLGVAPRSVSSFSSSVNQTAGGSSQPTIQYTIPANVQLGGAGTPTITVLANPPTSGTKRKFSEDDDSAMH